MWDTCFFYSGFGDGECKQMKPDDGCTLATRNFNHNVTIIKKISWSWGEQNIGVIRGRGKGEKNIDIILMH